MSYNMFTDICSGDDGGSIFGYTQAATMPFTNVKVLRSYAADRGGFANFREANGADLTTSIPVTGSFSMSDSYF